MREPSYFEQYCELAHIIAGVILGMIIQYILSSAITSDSPTLSCREGKLYEVYHEGNITIYDPTYNDCEENK